jgi:hypothetical protein
MAFKFSVISNTATFAVSSSTAATLEGTNVTMTLITTGVQDGQAIPYVISGTGITSADISGASLTGNFMVQSGHASVVLTIADDGITEGTEHLVLTVTHNGISYSASVDITDVPNKAIIVMYASGTVAADPFVNLTSATMSAFTMPVVTSGTVAADPFVNLTSATMSAFTMPVVTSGTVAADPFVNLTSATMSMANMIMYA